MTVITDDMRDIIASAMLSYAATTCPDGTPNLSPKGSVRAYDDDHLIFMDIASPNTIANLKANPSIEINSVDVVKRRGYRFKGTAEILQPGHEAYEWLNFWLLDLNGPGYPAHQTVLVRVDKVSAVESPAYTFGSAEEEELSETWYSRHEAAHNAATQGSAEGVWKKQ
ncbi:pyridoxamine 5'-phosphate oxidase family protein [Pseudarthrobacter sp. CC12]|uniref:pyridoxamine 5'-phosphate oxidase family protein n=1 Tax=Pseudarthrobacter sp. CC12 TaxID=3029193 RepID=UPI00326631A4